MAVDERDLRMVLVAFEDAVTWCETLADVTEELIASARDHASQRICSWLPGARLTVRSGKMVRGYFYVPHRWTHSAHQERP